MDISYLHGRRVVGVLTGEGAAVFDGATWAIELEGNGFILCFDDSYEPPAVQNLALTTSTTVTGDEVLLYFGTDNNPTGTLVSLRPDAYGVSDETYSGGAIVRPNEAPNEVTESPVPSSDTGVVVDGPTDEFVASEDARLAQEGARLADAQGDVQDGH